MAKTIRMNTGMKKRFINELKTGESVDDVFVLHEKTMGKKRDGSSYLNLTLSDKTGRIKAVIWDEADRFAAVTTAGDFVRIEGGVSEYRGILQLVVKSMARCVDAVDASDFLPVTKRNPDLMFERLKALTETIRTDCLRKLFAQFWADDGFVAAFKTAPAAKMMHHAYIGGLLEHSLSTALLADRVADHYAGIDRDLLMTGAILHDIGKIKEFEYRTRIEYSDEGRLINHIVIGIGMIEEKISRIPDFPTQTALLIKHLIISHHGTREFGSPEPPKTLDAVLLNYLDEIDSKINGIREFISSQDPDAEWTGYHRLLERHFFKPKPHTTQSSEE